MDETTQLLLSVGHHLRQLLEKRAVSSASIDKATAGYLEYLYSMRNSSASVNHLVLHFTTYTIKGRNKLGDILSSHSMSANIGCELIDFIEKRRKTGPSRENHGAISVSNNLNTTSVQVFENSSRLPDTEVKMEVEDKKPRISRWKRFKAKLARQRAQPALQTTSTTTTSLHETGGGVAVCSAPATALTLPNSRRSGIKIVTSPADPMTKSVEEGIRRAGYAAYRRITEGTSSNSALDMETIARARDLPLRLPISREMEPSVRQPTYKPNKHPTRKKKKPGDQQRSLPLTPGQKRQRKIAEALKNPLAFGTLNKKEKRAFFAATKSASTAHLSH